MGKNYQRFYKKRAIRYESEVAVRSALIDFLVYLVFLFSATVVAVYARHLYMFYFNKTVERHFLKADVSTGFNGTIKFMDIVTTSDFWNFLKHNFLVGLHEVSNEKDGTRDGVAGGNGTGGGGSGGGEAGSGEAGSGEAGSGGAGGEGNEGSGGGGNQVVKKMKRQLSVKEIKSEDQMIAKQKYQASQYEEIEEGDKQKEVPVSNFHSARARREFRNAPNSANPRVFLNENLLLGPPRLRQIRVVQNSCQVHNLFEKHFNACYAEYSRRVEDVSSVYKGTDFYTLYDAGATILWGKISAYIGAGFMKYLTFDIAKNKEILTELQANDWIDRGTRVAVMEFGLFNANTDLFVNVKILGELPPTGGMIPSIKLQSFKLYSIWTEDAFIITCAVIFYILILSFTIREIIEMKQGGFKSYAKSKWNWVDCSILLMAYLAFAYNIWHPIYLNALVERAAQDPDAYHSLDMICVMNLLYMDMMAICAFFVWIKIFKFISFNKTMMQFSQTIRRCSRDFLGFAVMFFIVFLAYAQLGMLIFGTTHPDFRNFGESVLTMVRMVLGDFEYKAIEEANPVLGPIYFLSYILLVIFILLNMFLAIINETYVTVKNEINHGESHLVAYISKLFRRMCAKIGKRKRKPKKKNKNDKDDTKESAAKSTSKDEEPKLDNTTKSIKMRRSEIIKTYFKRVPPQNQVFIEKLERLEKRVILIENVLEQLIGNFDKVLKKA